MGARTGECRYYSPACSVDGSSGRPWWGQLGCARAAARLNVGVGTFSYHTLSMEDMIVQLQRLKIREIEMSRGEFMLMKPPSAAMCQAARDKFDRAGIRCVSYYTATIKNDADLDLAVEFAKIFRGAQRVG